MKRGKERAKKGRRYEIFFYHPFNSVLGIFLLVTGGEFILFMGGNTALEHLLARSYPHRDRFLEEQILTLGCTIYADVVREPLGLTHNYPNSDQDIPFTKLPHKESGYIAWLPHYCPG